jgi:CxxC motif-containing protein (DUF1111 family)/predicted lipoprotein with Yx(FWY)xxD motif
VNKFIICVALLWTITGFEVTYAAFPIYADGDLAPLGAPDGVIDAADYLIANRIVLDQITATELELSHGDVYPVSAPDGVLNIQDMLLMQKQVLGLGDIQRANRYVQNLNLFEDGPSSVSAEVNGSSASTTVTVDGYTGPGATVTNDPNFVDPEDPGNTIWHVAVSGGIANAYLGTADLSSNSILDTGYDLSGSGLGQLVFDIKVISLSAGAILTVKIDSGYPNLGQVTLSPSQYSVGSWRRVAINFADLLANPGPGAGLDLHNVVNAFVIEVTGGNADFYLDNIFISHACADVDGCHATIKTKASIDADGDGVPDSSDLCPGTPPGSLVNPSGCPILVSDTDNDGVADSNDLCPGTPVGTSVDVNGCTIVTPVNEVSAAGGILVGGTGASQPGFSLYVFDNDIDSAGSNCNASCATSWPPVLVTDGGASGVSNLGTIIRDDGTLQATYQGRPLYFYAGDTSAGQTNGEGLGAVWWTVPYLEVYETLFDSSTVLEPALQEETPTALITRLADRARDRHAREDQFKIYDHYLSHYWEHRTAAIEIVDTIGKGGNTITFNVTTQWKLSTTEAELRFFYRGIGTVAEYYNNGVMTAVPGLDVPGEDARHYTRSLNYNQKFNRPLQVGDRLEFELSHFLDAVPNGRNNYYGTAILYIVGQGVVPWEAHGVFGDNATEREDSYPIPVAGWLGGNTTLPYQYSDEPDNHFMQMASNLSNINGQTFVLGRRVHHTDFGDGSHNEAVENPVFSELANKLGTHYINRSCVSCHARNGRALPPAVGQPLSQYVVKVGDASGNPDPQVGAVLQPQATLGASEGGVSISSWNESNGLRSPNFSFTGITPGNFSARIAPQLVGMGLLEAIVEADIEALADPDDSNSDGISGRMRLVTDAETGLTRIGRFGWKASQPTVKQQVAAAFNTDMGVMTSILPYPDCGSSQSGCGPSGVELSDQHLNDLSVYISMLGVSARRDLADPVALQGEVLFDSAGCTGCHTDTFQTSPYHPHAELRDQTIHPYTDLLLHDMGPGLASNLTEGNASGAEWRTAPLWNIGLTAGVSIGEAYLHDGRARNLNEAILWHGGEAETARQAYNSMSQSQKDALIAFLKTL